jgi:hypothetical protein
MRQFGLALMMMGLVACGAPTPAATPTAGSGSAEALQKAAPTLAAAAPAAAAEPTSQPSEGSAAPVKGLGFDRTPPDQAAGTTEHYGWAFTTAGPALPISTAIEACVPSGKVCRIAAKVSGVCQNKGCWMTLTAPELKQEVRVKFKDYAFFMPKNAMGGKVDIEGVLTEREMSQDEAQHYADDAAKAGEAPRKVTGPVKTYQIMATGADLSLVK